jgi:RNA polymerase sigma-70 factor
MDPPVVAEVGSEELVRRVLAGETECFAALVRRYEASVWKVASALLRDRVATENLVQQTFVNAYERLEQYEPGRDLLRWLKGIARNLVREELRKSSRESRTLSEYRSYLLAVADDEEQAERRSQELEQAVADCRSRLAPAAARALALHYDDGRSVEDVAASLARTLAATRQLLFRARLALRECVQGRLTT